MLHSTPDVWQAKNLVGPFNSSYKGCLVADYLNCGDPIGDALFADHRRRGVPMIVPTLLACEQSGTDPVETPSQVEYHSARLGRPIAVGMGTL